MGNLLSSYRDLFHDTHTYQILVEAFALFQSILPGLLIGLLLSSFLIAWWPVRQLKEWKPMHNRWAIPVMAALGVLSPFCSYLAIPIAATLITAGIPAAPVIAFLCATPLMNPTLFAMTWSVFGWPMALARAFAAVGFGLLGGFLTIRYSRILCRSLIPSNSESILKAPDKNSSFLNRWLRSITHTGRFVLTYVLLGIGIAATIKQLIPMDWITQTMGSQYGYSILFGALLGIPLYACGGGTIPIIQVLVDMGMAPGAALAFFISGPATKIQTLLMMKMTMGTPVTSTYVTLSLLWSILAGAIFQIFS